MTLRLLRGATGKKQQDIADALKALGRDATQAYVSQLERGKQSPTVELAIDLAKAYDVPFLELVKALGFEPDNDRQQVQEESDKK